jgi:hypothetical protein
VDTGELLTGLRALGAAEDDAGWWTLPDGRPMALRAAQQGVVHIAAIARKIRFAHDQVIASTRQEDVAVDLDMIVGVDRGYVPVYEDEVTSPSAFRIEQNRRRRLMAAIFVLSLVTAAVVGTLLGQRESGVLLRAAPSEKAAAPALAPPAPPHLPR